MVSDSDVRLFEKSTDIRLFKQCREQLHPPLCAIKFVEENEQHLCPIPERDDHIYVPQEMEYRLSPEKIASRILHKAKRKKLNIKTIAYSYDTEIEPRHFRKTIFVAIGPDTYLKATISLSGHISVQSTQAISLHKVGEPGISKTLHAHADAMAGDFLTKFDVDVSREEGHQTLTLTNTLSSYSWTAQLSLQGDSVTAIFTPQGFNFLIQGWRVSGELSMKLKGEIIHDSSWLADLENVAFGIIGSVAVIIAVLASPEVVAVVSTGLLGTASA